LSRDRVHWYQDRNKETEMTDFQRALAEFSALHLRVMGFRPRGVFFADVAAVRTAILVLKDYADEVSMTKFRAEMLG
jgi:hypothetical protein